MNRRGFLASCLALAAAPAIVRADSLMRIVPRETLILPSVDALRVFARDMWSAAIDQTFINHFVVFAHPSREADLRALIAKG